MNRIFTTSIFLSKIFIKERVFGLFILFSILTIAISIGLSGIEDKTDRLFRDITLALQSFTLHLVALFSTLLYLEKERRGGVYIFPLSSGLSRDSYFLSLNLSRVIVLSIPTLFFFVVNWSYSIVSGRELSLNFHLLLLFTSSLLLSSLFLTIAQYVSPLKSLVYAITIFFIGNSLDEVYIYGYILKEDETMQIVYQVLSRVVPNFYIFDSNEIGFKNIAHITIQFGIIYILGVVKFRKRILKVEN